MYNTCRVFHDRLFSLLCLLSKVLRCMQFREVKNPLVVYCSVMIPRVSQTHHSSMSIVLALFCLSTSAEVVREGMDANASDQYSTQDQCIQNDNDDQGWVSWAWSFVPAIINTEEEEQCYPEMEDTGNPSPLQSSLREPIVSVGFYCTKASVTFKVRN